jgi:hypothetical protein
LHEHGLRQTPAGFARKHAAEWNQHRADLARHDIVLVERLLRQRQQRRQYARTGAARIREIGDDLAHLHAETPLLEQPVKSRLAGGTSAERILHVGLLVEICVGIEESDELPAAQHELVYRVFPVLEQIARMDDDSTLMSSGIFSR